MHELICFSAFLYQYIEFLYSLRLPGGGTIPPLATPLNLPLSILFISDDHIWFNIHTQAVSSDNNFSSLTNFMQLICTAIHT